MSACLFCELFRARFGVEYVVVVVVVLSLQVCLFVLLTTACFYKTSRAYSLKGYGKTKTTNNRVEFSKSSVN